MSCGLVNAVTISWDPGLQLCPLRTKNDRCVIHSVQYCTKQQTNWWIFLHTSVEMDCLLQKLPFGLKNEYSLWNHKLEFTLQNYRIWNVLKNCSMVHNLHMRTSFLGCHLITIYNAEIFTESYFSLNNAWNIKFWNLFLWFEPLSPESFQAILNWFLQKLLQKFSRNSFWFSYRNNSIIFFFQIFRKLMRILKWIFLEVLLRFMH